MRTDAMIPWWLIQICQTLPLRSFGALMVQCWVDASRTRLWSWLIQDKKKLRSKLRVMMDHVNNVFSGPMMKLWSHLVSIDLLKDSGAYTISETWSSLLLRVLSMRDPVYHIYTTTESTKSFFWWVVEITQPECITSKSRAWRWWISFKHTTSCRPQRKLSALHPSLSAIRANKRSWEDIVSLIPKNLMHYRCAFPAKPEDSIRIITLRS